MALAYTLIKAQIEEQLGREYLEDAPLEGGSDGLLFLESTMDGDIYEINMTYRVRPPFSFPGWRGFRMANRYYGHRWSGYRIPGTEEERDYVGFYQRKRSYKTDAFIIEFQKPFVVQPNVGRKTHLIRLIPLYSPY